MLYFHTSLSSQVFNQSIDCKSLTVTLDTGEIQILPNHADFIGVIENSKVFIEGLKNERISFNVKNGLVIVKDNKCKVLALSIN